LSSALDANKLTPEQRCSYLLNTIDSYFANFQSVSKRRIKMLGFSETEFHLMSNIIEELSSSIDLSKLSPEQRFDSLLNAVNERIYNTDQQDAEIASLSQSILRRMSRSQTQPHIDDAENIEALWEGFFGKKPGLSYELCYILNHVGHSCDNPAKEMERLRPRNIFKPKKIHMPTRNPEFCWTKARAWSYFRKVVIPTIKELSSL